MTQNISRTIQQSGQLIDFYASLAERAWQNKNARAAVGWVEIAAEYAFGLHPGYFSSSRLERLLLEIAQTLPAVPLLASLWNGVPPGQRHILHVLTTAYRFGGHARITERWANYGSVQDEVHSVVLLSQGQQPIPSWLKNAVESTGGMLFDMREDDPLKRAAALRALWRAGTDCIILNTHPGDAVPTLAFGVEGGAPVLLFNAADHVLWLGVAVSDIVLDYRSSGQACSQKRRKVRRSEFLPIPLSQSSAHVDREAIRNQLGIPADTCVLLTIASAYKYAPLPPWDFTQLVGQVLTKKPNVHLLAAGPKDRWGWSRFAERFPQQVHVLGEVSDLASLHAAADIYLDSFPFASTTATLEAGLAGLPIHLPFNPTAPLMSNGAPSLAQIASYSDPQEYVHALVELLDAPERQIDMGQKIAQCIEDAHMSDAWMKQAQEFTNTPITHQVVLTKSDDTIEVSDLEWAKFQQQVSFLTTFGAGINCFKAHRRFLARSGRLAATFRMLLWYPRYLFSRPRLAVRLALEILRD